MKQKLLLFLFALICAVGVKAQSLDYFALTAQDGDVPVGVAQKSYQEDATPAVINGVLEYSFDKTNWTPLTSTSPNFTIAQGKTAYFRAQSEQPKLKLPIKFNDGESGMMESIGRLVASGNIMSLLDRTCNSTTLGEEAFSLLFSNMLFLKSAKDIQLPSLTLAEGCYFEMFQNCQNLEDVPSLPAETLVSTCYYNMFGECGKISSVTLGAKVIPSEDCVFQMLPSIGGGIIYITEELDNNSEQKGYLFNPFNVELWTAEVPGKASTIDLLAHEDPDHPGNYYTTFYDSKYSWVVSTEGAQAYAGKVSISALDGTQHLYLNALWQNKICKGYGAIIHSTTPNIKLTLTEEFITSPTDDLFGYDEDTADTDNYILSYGTNGLGFYKSPTGILAAHKAYLYHARVSHAKAITMIFEDEATGISSVIEDMNESDVIYNYSGQRSNYLQKGINIVNGKTIFNK